MYDGSALNKTRKKIYFEPIENMMFNNFVLISIWRNRRHIEISTEYIIHRGFTITYLASTQIIKTFSGMH